jgi:formylglycine-generating enzyme required for sulfatase activity/beta-lactamase regulating signal transducer with metallopeptidase domain
MELEKFLLLLAEHLIKGLVVLVGGWVVVGMCKGRSAALRSLVWLGVFLMLLISPLAQPLIPRIGLGGKQAGMRSSAMGQESVLQSNAAGLIPSPDEGSFIEGRFEADSADLSGLELAGFNAQGFSGSSAESRQERDANPGHFPAGIELGEIAWKGFGVLWFLGFGLLLLRWVFAVLRTIWVGRLAETLSRRDICDVVAQVCAEFGCGGRARVLLGRSGSMPVAWGVFRPTVLLPAEASEWPRERLVRVLRHELAHVVRRDALGRWICAVACAFHWPNPLVWMAAKAFRNAQEQATDDMVLGCGEEPSEYAGELVTAARLFALQTGLGSIPMAVPSSLEGRLLAILDPQRDRRRVGPFVLGSSIAGMIVVVWFGASVRLYGEVAVSNVQAEQASDTKRVTVRYDVSGVTGNVGVKLEASRDGGATWTVPVSSTSQDIGKSVAPSASRVIFWDAKLDWPGQVSDQMRFRVSVDDHLVPVEGGKLPADSPLGGMGVGKFSMGRFEVQREEWDRVSSWAAGNGYPDLDESIAHAGKQPVGNISWYQAVKWCNARSEMEGLIPVYRITQNGVSEVYRAGDLNPHIQPVANGYRLPLEKEWEFAARGGVLNTGFTYSGSNNPDEVAWYAANASGEVRTVGLLKPNELGLHDMSGNIGEWCWETWDYVAPKRPTRGGTVYKQSQAVNLISRGFGEADSKYADLGFRVARGTDFVLVGGGTLPASSALGLLTVDFFQIARYEVNSLEWKEVRDWALNNGYQINQGSGNYAKAWADMDWYDAVKWCNARSEKEGLVPVYAVNGAVYKAGQEVPSIVPEANGYRLPTEAEWEFAARGGIKTNGYAYSGSDTLSEVALTEHNQFPGTKAPNELGLYDMSGDVAEWCWADASVGAAPVRGGAFFAGNPSVECRVDTRGGLVRSDKYPNVGFRVVLNATR